MHPWELASSFPTPYRLTWLIWSRCTQPKGLHPRRLQIKLCHILLQHVLCSLNAWWDFQTDCFHVRLAVLGSTLADHLQRFSKFLEILHGVKRFSTPGPKLPTRPQCSPSLGITSGPLYYVNVVITGTTLLHNSISENQTFPCLHYFALVTRPESRDSKQSLVANSLRCSRGLSIPHVIDKTSFTVYPHNPPHELVTI